MAEKRESKVFNFAILAILGCSLILVSVLQLQRPANTVSMAPKAVLPLAKTKDVNTANFDLFHNKQAALYAGRLTVSDVHSRFEQLGYELDPVLDGQQAVPRLFLSSLPYDLKTIEQTEERKSLFFRTLLPLVLKVNEEIIANRSKVWRLRHRLNMGQAIHAQDRIWLDAAFQRYRVKQNSFDRLLQKMDMVPPSLALAQAAEESGWGTSRFAREGNALFGQWTFNENDKGIVPKNRTDGKTHRIKAFDTLGDSLKDYVHNLNTHKAYFKLRQQRLMMRLARKPLDGYKLAETLNKYSERGEEYIIGLKAIMEKNDLGRFDDANLDNASNKVINGPLI